MNRITNWFLFDFVLFVFFFQFFAFILSMKMKKQKWFHYVTQSTCLNVKKANKFYLYLLLKKYNYPINICNWARMQCTTAVVLYSFLFAKFSISRQLYLFSFFFLSLNIINNNMQGCMFVQVLYKLFIVCCKWVLSELNW